MCATLTIREACSDDLGCLLELYLQLSPDNAPFSLVTAENVFSRFLKYQGSAIFLGDIGGVLVSSCTLVIVPNLTKGGHPYALVENVITHSDHRSRGYGKAVLERATQHAWSYDCYKVMLLTGSKDAGTLAFYEKAGFQQSKTGFQKRR